MNEEQLIIQQVYKAKENMQKADELINDYMPFIKAETAKFLRRPPIEGHDDELSIAMIAFHEAICGYARNRGAFLKYASMLIRSRLIDYARKEMRHSGAISLENGSEKEGTSLSDTLADQKNHSEETDTRETTKAEIQELRKQMEGFGVSLTDVAENCPKQKRTLDACRKALQYAKETPDILEELLRTKRLPISKLVQGGADRKTLERHRKYMVALLLVFTNGYELIRGHLKQVMKGVATK
jgi:RNA polymerase sigma factor